MTVNLFFFFFLLLIVLVLKENTTTEYLYFFFVILLKRILSLECLYLIFIFRANKKKKKGKLSYSQPTNLLDALKSPSQTILSLSIDYSI